MAARDADIEKAKEIMSRLLKQPPKTHDEMTGKERGNESLTIKPVPKKRGGNSVPSRRPK